MQHSRLEAGDRERFAILEIDPALAGTDADISLKLKESGLDWLGNAFIYSDMDAAAGDLGGTWIPGIVHRRVVVGQELVACLTPKLVEASMLLMVTPLPDDGWEVLYRKGDSGTMAQALSRVFEDGATELAERVKRIRDEGGIDGLDTMIDTFLKVFPDARSRILWVARREKSEAREMDEVQ